MEKNELKETKSLSSCIYKKMSELSIEEIKSLTKFKVRLIPYVSLNKKVGIERCTFSYEFSIGDNGIVINPQGSNTKEYLTLDEYNQARIEANCMDPIYLKKSFVKTVYCRFVKGVKLDNTKYYQLQFWINLNGSPKNHFFSNTELVLLSSVVKNKLLNISFIEKPIDISDEVSNSFILSEIEL